MSRQIIKLNLDADDKSQKALSDKELKKAFEAILERADDGLADADDVAFLKARREYLTDEQLVRGTGMNFAEIEAEAQELASAPAEKPLAKMTVEELTAKAEELELELTGDEKKKDLIALIEEATA